MTEELLSQAKQLHQQSIVADGHCDTVHLFRRRQGGYDFALDNSIGHVDLPRLHRGGINIQCFAVCVEQNYKPCGALKRTLSLFEHFLQVMEENKDKVAIIRDRNGLDEALAGRKLASLLTVEGGEALEGNLDVLYSLYRLGMRGMGLTWNDRNELADGVGVGSAAGGLTQFGRSVVREMNRLGIMVDASHLSPRSYYDVLEHSATPVVVTHANASGVYAHRRNLDDDQLRALRDQGGVIGICFYPRFISSPQNTGIESLLDHFSYIAHHFGVGMLALGSDFDGIDEVITGLEDVSKLPVLTAGLLGRGFSEDEVSLILGGNFMKVLGKILPERQEV